MVEMTRQLAELGPTLEKNDEEVEVIALVPYLGLEDKRKPDGKPYLVTRRRARELVTNGLARYSDQAGPATSPAKPTQRPILSLKKDVR